MNILAKIYLEGHLAVCGHISVNLPFRSCFLFFNHQLNFSPYAPAGFVLMKHRGISSTRNDSRVVLD